MMGTVHDEVNRLNADCEAAYAADDFEGVAAFYTHDALFLIPGRKVIQGRQAIRDAYAGFAEAGVKRYRFETIDLEDHGGIVLELGKATGYGGSDELLSEDHYVIAWKREADGVLRLHWDVVSSSHR